MGSGRLVGPAPMRVVELARGVLRVAVGVAVAGGPHQQPDAGDAAGDPDDAPDRVGEGRERQGAYLRSTTIVFTEAVTPSATSTTTT